MDLQKWKIWQSGLTDDEKELFEKQEAVEAVFKQEKEQVSQTVNTKGFKIILDKVVNDIEINKNKLLTCSDKELTKLQTEIKARKEFLDKWTPYVV